MPDQITRLLDQIDRLDQEATKGPWEIVDEEYDDNTIAHVTRSARLETVERIVHADDATPADREFIALARTALPQLAAALQAVLVVHQKTEHQRAYGFPRADKWEHYCMEDNQSWPCPTVRAITDALGDSQ